MAKQEHALDIVTGIITAISDTKPIFFQRDGDLFVASEAGFGVLRNYLITREIQKSAESTGTDKYIKAIRFSSDTRDYSLEDIANSAMQLSKLPDDGKIRIVSHSESYHSHKHGYAQDGLDVALQYAGEMNREKYLELFRQAEERDWTRNAVITQDMALCFPVEVEFGKGVTDGWTASTSPIIRDFHDASVLSGQPLNSYLFTNLQLLTIGEDDIEGLSKRFAKTVEVIAGHKDQLSRYVTNLNRTHGAKERQVATKRHEARVEMMEQVRQDAHEQWDKDAETE